VPRGFLALADKGAEVSPDQMRLMLRSLLVDRFQRRIEPETRTGTVYRLIARNAHDLKPPATPEGRSLVATMRNDHRRTEPDLRA
jgi:uncharacterized protein (TIGR03435 family)